MLVLRCKFLLILFVPVMLSAQTTWDHVESVDDACKAWPDRIESIFRQLNLEGEDLHQVKQAYESNNISEACDLLLKYYASKAPKRAINTVLPAESTKRNALADSIVQDIFTFQQVTGRVPRTTGGHLSWSFEGPQDDIEWAWALNRHYPVNTLLPLYYETGNPVYLKYIDRFIKDWIIKSTPYPAKKSSTAMWRGLEVSFRVKVWSKVFYDLMQSTHISPATRLLIVSSVPDHAHYARNFHGQTNWLTMEMSGLATFATSWPEFKISKERLDYSISAITQSLKEQVYPDGVQTELTSHYHTTALVNFALFKDICDRNEIELPEYFVRQIENMWNYLAYSIRPNGYGVLNNDGDLDYNRNRLLKVASDYNREDWKYIVSNGEGGEQPPSLPSLIFPWAGQAIFRSGYDKNAQWSFFDIGPWGSGHQHNDMLHISIAAFGHDFLVDAGRFAYRGEIANKFRSYALGSHSHNVVLIDGKGQDKGDLLTEKEVSPTDYSIKAEESLARGSFDRFKGIEGSCKQTRTLYYKTGEFWIVVDQFTTDRPRKIETLWHWHPDCDVVVRGNETIAENNGNRFLIVPINEKKWEIGLVKGQETPEIQGWYSPEYNKFMPNFATTYSGSIDGNETIAWLLYPTQEKNRKVDARIIDKTEKELKIRISDGIKTSVISIPITSTHSR